MKLGIMQPYLFPYLGYFQLINSVDRMIIYDDIKYTKQSWINRNRILKNATYAYITIPLKKDSDYRLIKERKISPAFKVERNKLLFKIKNTYRAAPYFHRTFPLIEDILMCKDDNLFDFIMNSLEKILKFLEISTSIKLSSEISLHPHLKGQKKVIEICNKQFADIYINSIGGIELYNEIDFNAKNLELKFLKPILLPYAQFSHNFVPDLSIIDVLMFNSQEKVSEMLLDFELI